MPARPCPVCEYLHPATWECPEMQSEVMVRLAMDRLRKVGGGGRDEEMGFLWRKLKALKGG